MASRTQRAASQLGRGVEQVEDTIDSLASSLGDTLGDRLPALAERLADRFPDVAEQLAERIGDRVPALQRYLPNRRSPAEDALAFIGGLLFGALAGALAAVLLAPSDGKTLRARLQERIDGLMGYSPPPPATAEDAAEDAVDAGPAIAGEASASTPPVPAPPARTEGETPSPQTGPAL